MLRTRELLAEPSLRKRSGTYLPKYLRIPNALRLDGQNPQGAERALYSAYSTRVCYGASPSAFFRNIYHRTCFSVRCSAVLSCGVSSAASLSAIAAMLVCAMLLSAAKYRSF